MPKLTPDPKLDAYLAWHEHYMDCKPCGESIGFEKCCPKGRILQKAWNDLEGEPDPMVVASALLACLPLLLKRTGRKP